LVHLADARLLAAKLRFDIAQGKDPLAERQRSLRQISFGDLHQRYVKEHAQKKNKSWAQADRLVRKHLFPVWGRRDAATITRADVRTMMGRIKRPITANQTLAAASAVFTWAVKMEIIAVNVCRGIEANPTTTRERILSDTEIRAFWQQASSDHDPIKAAALKVLLLTGQRRNEVCCMRREHIADGWWTLPGKPELGWPGTKNARTHRVALSETVQDIIADVETIRPSRPNGDNGFVFGTAVASLDRTMRDVCKTLNVERATPHDLRRTFGSTVTRLGYSRQSMDRILNHADRSVGAIYDRHQYQKEDRRIMESVSRHIMAMVEGTEGDNVVRAKF
jgi:integrase